MVPTVEFPPATPLTDQSTVALLLGVSLRGSACETGFNPAPSLKPPPPDCAVPGGGVPAGSVAENCCLAPARTLAVAGVILMPELLLSAQLDRNNAANKRTQPPAEVWKEFLDIRWVIVRIIETLTEIAWQK